jgi:anti-sigma regulatory factor (Ser/Thr protein kinase)
VTRGTAESLALTAVADELSFDVPRWEHAPGLARTRVREAFAGRIPPRQLEDLLVIVSELSTNALLYGRGDIRVRVQLDGGVVRGEVIDDGKGFERAVAQHGIDAVGGKGLHIVGSLAREWGIHDGSSHVWFELAPGEESETADPQLGADERPDALDD